MGGEPGHVDLAVVHPATPGLPVDGRSDLAEPGSRQRLADEAWRVRDAAALVVGERGLARVEQGDLVHAMRGAPVQTSAGRGKGWSWIPRERDRKRRGVAWSGVAPSRGIEPEPPGKKRPANGPRSERSRGRSRRPRERSVQGLLVLERRLPPEDVARGPRLGGDGAEARPEAGGDESARRHRRSGRRTPAARRTPAHATPYGTGTRTPGPPRADGTPARGASCSRSGRRRR